MQSETGFPSSYQLKSYVASKFRLKLAARAVLSADAGLLVSNYMWVHNRVAVILRLFLFVVYEFLSPLQMVRYVIKITCTKFEQNIWNFSGSSTTLKLRVVSSHKNAQYTTFTTN